MKSVGLEFPSSSGYCPYLTSLGEDKEIYGIKKSICIRKLLLW